LSIVIYLFYFLENEYIILSSLYNVLNDVSFFSVFGSVPVNWLFDKVLWEKKSLEVSKIKFFFFKKKKKLQKIDLI